MARVTTIVAALGLLLVWPGDAARAEKDKNIDHIVIVLDASGSMDADMGGPSRMEAAKAALGEVLKSVPETTYVGLLVFSGLNKSADWVYPLGPLNHENFMAALRPLEPSGATPLGTYLKKGADELLANRQERYGYGSYRLLIVTDGEASGPTEEGMVQSFTPEVMSRGITMDVIGVDMDADHTLATKVHTYRNAADPKSLAREIQNILAEVSTQDGGSGDVAKLFDEIDGLEVALATNMLGALTSSGNYPIGEKPPPEVKPAAADTATPPQPPTGTPTPAPSGSKPEPRASADSGSDSDSDEGGGGTFIIILLIGVAGVVGWLLASKRKS